MAPRTGADGLLRAQSSKATSTGILLVLVAALAIVFGGCGGGSGSPSTESSSSTASAASTGQAGERQRSTGTDSPDPSPKEPGGSTPHSSKDEQANPTGKQGPHIKEPKGPEEPAPTQKQREEATVASMTLSGPALQPGPESISTLPATYTCKGKDTWPTLHWSGIPNGTAELALLVLNVEPVNEALFFDWALTGLDPTSSGLDSGKLPKGAIVGRNSFGKIGYSICPPSGHETYLFALYALPDSIPAHKGFDPKAFRRRVLALSGNSGLLAVGYG